MIEYKDLIEDDQLTENKIQSIMNKPFNSKMNRILMNTNRIKNKDIKLLNENLLNIYGMIHNDLKE